MASVTLMSLMKDVAAALEFDKRERSEDAYRKYLECVLRVTTSLLKALHTNEGHVYIDRDLAKMVKLGQQCMDRVGNLVQNKFIARAPTNTPKNLNLPVASGTSHQSSSSTGSSISTPGTPGSGTVTPVFSSQTSVTSPDVQDRRGSVHKRLGSDGGSGIKVTGRMTMRQLSPMEMASKQNQQLLTAFRKRQAMAKSRSASATLSLTLQRKMAENFAIAKAQEEALAKKMKERQARLEEQAARRFHTPMGLSEEEQHQRQIYRKVLEFEQEQVWVADLRQSLENNPTDLDIISELITQILACSSHPLTGELAHYQNRLLDKVSHIVAEKEAIVDNIKVPLEETMHSRLKPFQSKSSSKRNQSTEKFEMDQSKTVLQKDDDNRPMSDSETSDRDRTGSVDTGIGSFVDKETEGESELEKSAEDNVEVVDKDMTQVTVEIKDDIKKAISEGVKLQKIIGKEEKAVKSICRQVTEDYELYSQQNMDDLFDSSDDSDTDVQEEVADDLDKENANSTLDKSDEAEGGVNEDLDNADEPDTEKDANDVNKPETDTKSSQRKVLTKNPSFENLDSKIAELKNEAYHRHLKGISEDILTSIDKVKVLFVIAFEQLDSAEGRDQCNAIVEEVFFRPLWKHLLNLFRLANEPKEISLAYIMTENLTCSPSTFQVRAELCLAEPVNDGGGYPYQSAVEELTGVTKCSSMLEKLDYLVKASKQVMLCVEQFYTARGEQVPSIGADDLLPVLCYVVTKSRLPQLVSECHAIERFIHEGYMFGEEGYCLTSIQTAVNFLVSDGLQKCAG